MINPLTPLNQFFESVGPEDTVTTRMLSCIPVICNLFLEAKKNQLAEDGKTLKEITDIVKDWRVGQLLIIPLIARKLEEMSLKQRLIALGGMTFCAVVHEVHLDGVIEQAERTL